MQRGVVGAANLNLLLQQALNFLARASTAAAIPTAQGDA